MGKVYEANTLLAYAKGRVQAYKLFDEQLDALKKALHDVATLDHEFQGKGADNIKSFYKTQVDTVTHWKSLVSSHQSYFNSIADYAEQAKLKGDTVVDVSFLEQELAVANDRSKQMVEQQHIELESILSNIEDIIHITPFSTEAIEDDISTAEKKRTDTITAVEELDNQLSSEYGMLGPIYESVQFSVNGLEQMTSQGGSAYQLVFDAKAYKNSEAYKTQLQIDKVASDYVEGKAEQRQQIKAQKEAIEAEKQRQIQANKPWYEKGLDIAGELTGYYDFKRATEGFDPVTHKKLSATQRVTAGAMAAAGFIPFVGWAGRAAKGGNAVYKTTKGMSAAHHAMALYQTPKTFKTLEQTEKGLYGLILTNGMYEFTTGKDVLGNKLTKEEQQASLFQAAGGLLGVGVSVKGTAGIAKDVTKSIADVKYIKEKIVKTSIQNTADLKLAFAMENFINTPIMNQANNVERLGHLFSTMKVGERVPTTINTNIQRLIPGKPGEVTGGSSTKLGKNMFEQMGLPRSTKRTPYQAQHVIPKEFRSHPIIKKIGMDMDHASNGFFLQIPEENVSATSRHKGYHSVYSNFVRKKLDEMDVNQSVDDLEKQVFELQTKLKVLQEKGLPLYLKDNYLEKELKKVKEIGIESYKREREKGNIRIKPVWKRGGGATMDLWERWFNK
ncbi:T7SS effector LXG polymorphic toxin [Priestia megaterium]|uniref:T7SS effector LXG polymorphic toxin n=1 Tax=Priestia megaterium TaxID=1404 RepID=UPI0018673DDB|nr:T7SS effector LXG polymorphic toxin [Priestia megaterium]MBE2978193.1 AHH domain-containing protein [Priestia megaterium]